MGGRSVLRTSLLLGSLRPWRACLRFVLKAGRRSSRLVAESSPAPEKISRFLSLPPAHSVFRIPFEYSGLVSAFIAPPVGRRLGRRVSLAFGSRRASLLCPRSLSPSPLAEIFFPFEEGEKEFRSYVGGDGSVSELFSRGPRHNFRSKSKEVSPFVLVFGLGSVSGELATSVRKLPGHERVFPGNSLLRLRNSLLRTRRSTARTARKCLRDPATESLFLRTTFKRFVSLRLPNIFTRGSE